MFDRDADRRRASGLCGFKPPATPDALSRMTERHKTDLLHALAADLGMVVSRKEPRSLSEPLMASQPLAPLFTGAEVLPYSLPPVPGFRPPYGPTAEEIVLDALARIGAAK